MNSHQSNKQAYTTTTQVEIKSRKYLNSLKIKKPIVFKQKITKQQEHQLTSILEEFFFYDLTFHGVIRTMKLNNFIGDNQQINFEAKIEKFHNVQGLSLKRIQLQGKHVTQVIKTISHITFDKLTTLNLQNSSINNIQFLVWLQSPLLEQISLKDNQISKTHALSKVALPFLKEVNINQNPINMCQLQSLARLQLTKEKLFSIRFSFLKKRQIKPTQRENNSLQETTLKTYNTINCFKLFQSFNLKSQTLQRSLVDNEDQILAKIIINGYKAFTRSS